MTGVGRPVVIPDRIDDADLVRTIGPASAEKANSSTVSRDVLISQGAAALADILMRACLDHPQLAAELADLQAPQRTDGPEVKSTLAMAGEQPDDPYMVADARPCRWCSMPFAVSRRPMRRSW